MEKKPNFSWTIGLVVKLFVSNFWDCSVLKRIKINLFGNIGMMGGRGVGLSQLVEVSLPLISLILLTMCSSTWIKMNGSGRLINQTRLFSSLLGNILIPFFCQILSLIQDGVGTSRKNSISFFGVLSATGYPQDGFLSNKGIEIGYILCPVCTSSPETVEHTLWTCSLATSVWLKTFQWLNLDFPSSLTIAEVLEDLDDRHFSKENK